MGTSPGINRTLNIEDKMKAKDKIIFGLMILLIIGGGYIQYTYTEAEKHMVAIEETIKTRVDEVNDEFREDLRKLNLQFIGRGKHVRRAQQDIIANTKLIGRTADSLGTMIEDVAYKLNEFERDVNKRFLSAEQDLRDLQDSFDSERRRNTRRFSDIEQQITSLQNDLNEIESLEIIQKAKAKKKEK